MYYKVKDELQNFEQQQHQQQNSQTEIVYQNSVSFINEANIQGVVNYNQFLNNNSSVVESIKKENLELMQTHSIIDQGQDYVSLRNSSQAANIQQCLPGNGVGSGGGDGDNGGCSSATINEYDFNFDPFDSNVLFNLNDMEFI